MIGEADKDRARHHLGYLGVQEAATFQLGVPAAVQTQFMIERAWEKVLPSAEPRFVSTLDELDKIECQISGNTENVAVESIGEITMRKDEFKQLIIRYKFWRGSLANLLGIIPNPYDQREWLGMGWNGGGNGVNVRVR